MARFFVWREHIFSAHAVSALRRLRLCQGTLRGRWPVPAKRAWRMVVAQWHAVGLAPR